VAAVIDIGTLLALSARFSAVTTISWTDVTLLAVSAAHAAGAAARTASDAPASPHPRRVRGQKFARAACRWASVLSSAVMADNPLVCADRSLIAVTLIYSTCSNVGISPRRVLSVKIFDMKVRK
jgi:hypothetical protein